MTLKICLLVSDDMDDHQAISEALGLISENTILLNIIDSQKAIQLLQQDDCQPDHLILDLSMHGIKVNSILKTVRQNNKNIKLPIVLFGTQQEYSLIDTNDDVIFYNKEFKFSELKTLLKKAFAQ